MMWGKRSEDIRVEKQYMNRAERENTGGIKGGEKAVWGRPYMCSWRAGVKKKPF